MIKNGKKIKLAQKACKLNGIRGIFNNVKASLPLNKLKAHPVRNAFIVLAAGAVLWVGITTINAYIYNNNRPVLGKDFAPGNVFDNNGNDIEFDDKGQIVEDDTTEQELNILKTQISKQFNKDAGRRCADKIESMDKIVAMSLLPYNSFDDDNEFDKYILSILFEANGQIYSLEYLTGKEFESNSSIQKEFLGDFLSYINIQSGDCTLDACRKMSEIGTEIAASLGATYVGDSYVGYLQSGEPCYNIPVINGEKVTIYRATCRAIDGPELDPMETLLSQINGGDEIFSEIEAEQNFDDLDKVLKYLQDASYENLTTGATQISQR